MDKSKFKGLTRSLLSAKELSSILPLILLATVAIIVNPSFLSTSNIFDMLRSASFSLVLAVPITFLMSAGMMDLSVGATITMGGIVSVIANVNGLPLWLCVLLGIAAGALIGALNGVIVVYCKMPAFIATMGTQYAINGLISVVTGNNAVTGVTDAFKAISQTRLAGNLSITVIYALVIAVAGHIILTRTKYGREVLAVGGNRETAFLSGINYKKKQMQLFVIVGMFAAFSGVLYASRFASAQLNVAGGAELTIIASVIIGGSSLFGGAGTIIGSSLGCILFAAINNALVVMGVTTYWQKVVFGGILLLALFIDQYRRKKAAGE